MFGQFDPSVIVSAGWCLIVGCFVGKRIGGYTIASLFQRRWSIWLRIITAITVVVVGGFAANAASDLAILIRNLPMPDWARVSYGTLMILTGSWMLFRLKDNDLITYGVIELFFGLATAVVTMSELQKPMALSKMLGIVASAYLLIRGAENFRKGRKQNL